MTNPYRTSAPREPSSGPKRRVAWARLGAGAALVAAVVPLRAPAGPSEVRRETVRRARSEVRGVDEAWRARRLALDEARARMLACPEADRDACREAIARDMLDGAWSRRLPAAAFLRPVPKRGERFGP